MPELAYRHLDVRRDGEILVLTPTSHELRGPKLSSALLKELLAAHTEHGEPTKVVLDLRPVDYLASLGLATLLRFRRHLDGRGAQLLLCHVASFLAEILQASRLTGADPDVFFLVPDYRDVLKVLATAR